jgi:hypothetical protein
MNRCKSRLFGGSGTDSAHADDADQFASFETRSPA